ncbi:hypothetical protein PSTT_08926 [Puccinia striiformis]|uniref:Uncharacterized protein n=1 Tax=Puccinia striiformis TaxID=27350 RepID=A0A2S4VAT2_9BASI|nr:hypothetical protein PSTT_08926 [Puccinia striiformis]
MIESITCMLLDLNVSSPLPNPKELRPHPYTHGFNRAPTVLSSDSESTAIDGPVLGHKTDRRDSFYSALE